MRAAQVLILLTVCAGLVSCSDDRSPEAQLRDTIDAMELAAEEGRRSDFMDHVAPDFSGQRGRLNHQELADLLRVQILVHSRVHAVVSNLEVELVGSRARASMHALLTGGPKAWLPDAGRVFKIETGWKLDEEGDWILISADWEPVL
ncbi:MAG: hypothetical protein R3200_01410 [Xanthomonadales bacterium]|nr:hypothetical protein [Xanthomonadales bacterium]